jgi:hypothetical protein
MADLTADQIEYIRAMSGDDTLTYEVSDLLLPKLYDRAVLVPSVVSGRVSADDVTVVLVLQARVAKAARLVNEINEAQVQKSLSQKFDHLQATLEAWERRTGMSGGVITVGRFSLGLDADCDTLNEWGYPQ